MFFLSFWRSWETSPCSKRAQQVLLWLDLFDFLIWSGVYLQCNSVIRPLRYYEHFFLARRDWVHFFLILQRRYIYIHWYYKRWPPFRVPSHNGICNFSSFIRPVEYQVRISEEISVSNCNLLAECRRKCVLNESLQSRQVKRTPQDSILNDLIIWKMNPLVVPVTSVKFKSALLHA